MTKATITSIVQTNSVGLFSITFEGNISFNNVSK